MNPCMAHRGWSGKTPENTMAAIDLALRTPFIQAIEIDVQLTRDGVPILIHDFTLDRTTNGTGEVAEFTLEQLSRLDAGSWFAPQFTGERIPTLKEVLLAAKGKCKLNIELKKGGYLYPELEKQVVELIRRWEMHSEVCITSFNHEVIESIRDMDPEIETGLIIYGKPTMIKEQLLKTGATILSMAYPYLTREFVSSMIDEGIKMIAWTIDEPKDIEKAMKLHPQLQIATNHPDRMANLRIR